MSFLVHLFVTLIYQPFFNILVFFYWLLGIITRGHPDMGVAVILLTIVIRGLLLPISLSGDKSEKDRREIAAKIHQLEETYAYDPVILRQKKQQLMRSSHKIIWGEVLSLFIQVGITLMLWRIFAQGLEGEDIHLLYSFMPKVAQPYNLVFLGKFDLSHSSVVLNVIQSFCIFVLETLTIYTSPYPPAKGEVVRLQLVLPIVSFFVFMFLPAGKKVFIITTLIISIVLRLYKFVKRKYEDYRDKQEKGDGMGLDAVPETETIVKEVP